MGERYDLMLDNASTRVSPRTKKQIAKRSVPVLSYISGAGDLGMTIIVPLLIALGIGMWVDVAWATRPTGTLVGLVLGLALSIVTTARKVQEMIRQ